VSGLGIFLVGLTILVGIVGVVVPMLPGGLLVVIAVLAWAGVEGDTDALAAVQAGVERVCVGLGWPADEQQYTPHITLARARGRPSAPDALSALLDRRAAYTFGGFDVRAITLYASRPAPGGAIYLPLSRRPLGEGGPPL